MADMYPQYWTPSIGGIFVKFQFIEQIALTGNGILRMPGERIATPVCALARNDILVGIYCLIKQEKR